MADLAEKLTNKRTALAHGMPDERYGKCEFRGVECINHVWHFLDTGSDLLVLSAGSFDRLTRWDFVMAPIDSTRGPGIRSG